MLETLQAGSSLRHLRPRVVALVAAILVGCAIGELPAALAQSGSGDALAERFAKDGEAAAGQRRRDEAEMLERARAESSGAPAGRPTPEAASGPVSPEASSAAAAATAQPHSAPAEVVVGGSADEVREQAIQAEVAKRVSEAERQAELDRISARIREAQERARQGADGAREAGSAIVTEPPTRPAAPTYTYTPPPAAAELRSTRATILIIMEPGRRGIRRVNKLADPVLCVDDTCYVSQGADRHAKAMPRGRALGTFNTLGNRAGACRNSLVCVFRNVEIGDDAAWVQPVDLRLMRHDRRRASRVRIDKTCTITAGRLQCRRLVSAPDYALWVVPEPIASKAGPAALVQAVQSGLASTDRAAAGTD